MPVPTGKHQPGIVASSGILRRRRGAAGEGPAEAPEMIWGPEHLPDEERQRELGLEMGKLRGESHESIKGVSEDGARLCSGTG